MFEAFACTGKGRHSGAFRTVAFFGLISILDHCCNINPEPRTCAALPAAYRVRVSRRVRAWQNACAKSKSSAIRAFGELEVASRNQNAPFSACLLFVLRSRKHAIRAEVF